MSARRQPTRKGTVRATAPMRRPGAPTPKGHVTATSTMHQVKPRTKPRRTTTRRSATGLLYQGDWVTGYNDEAPTCAATAIANSLLGVTGLRVTDDDVLLLYRQSGGNGLGVSLAESLTALATYGIAGHFPARIHRCGETPADSEYAMVPQTEPFCNGDIVGLVWHGDREVSVPDSETERSSVVEAGTHAACYTELGLISWGSIVSEDWELDGEAWRIDWAA